MDEKTDWLYQKLTGSQPEMADDRKLEQLAEKLQAPGYLQEKIRQQERFDYRRGEKEFLRATRQHPSRRILRLCAAATILISLGIASLYLFQEPPMAPETAQTHADIPRDEKQKAYLRISAAEEYPLQQDTFSLHLAKGLDVKVDGQGIHYQNSDATLEAEQQPEVHTLVVPRGGEYCITLADHTKVWLNSDSELSYPTYFKGETREVTVSGEAYFEVAKQEGKPFIVHTDYGQIQVWGTAFNVEAYRDEDSFVTTLVNGSISCSLTNGQHFRLTPDDQLIYRKQEGATLSKTDTRIATGWKDGIFLFRNRRFEEITRQLARWYDLDVVYLDEEVKDLHFSGDLNRFKNIGTFIEMFEKSAGVRLYQQGTTLYITNSRHLNN